MISFRAWIALLLAASIFFLSGTVCAQDNFTIVDIDIEGNRKATKSLILGVSSFDLGSPLTPSDITDTIRRLYGLGIFSDVKIDVEPVESGVKIFIVVSELPKLSGLTFEGNDKLSSKDLKDKLGIAVGGYISPYLINRTKNRIIGLYADKGYFQAEVEPSLIYANDSTEALLSFKINEKSKVKVEKVILTGNVRVEANDIIKKMRNRKRGFLKSSDFAQDKYEEDLVKVIEEYHKKGFNDAHLISDSMTIDTTRNRMTIYLHVYEGPEYYFGKTEFIDNEKFDAELLTRLLKFKTGEVFNGENYDESIYEIYTAYQDIGHLHVQVLDEKHTRADSIIDITYRITEGLPSKINLVKIVGNTKTKEHVIRREMSSRPGQIYNRSLLLRSMRDVMALNFFQNVLPTPIDLPSGDVDIEFEVEEKQTGQVSAGAGYNSRDKVVGSVGMAIPNFRGLGQNVSFNIDFGSKRNSLVLSFTEPWLFGRPTLLGLDAYTTNQRWFDEYTEGRQGGLIRVGRRLRWPDNYFRIYGSYRLERNRFYDFNDNYILNNSYKHYDYIYYTDNVVVDTTSDVDTYPLPDSTSINPREAYPGSILMYDENWLTSSRISLTITRDSRNLPEFATSGSQLSYSFENTGGIMGGFWEYQKHSFSAAKFFPLFWKFALAAKIQYKVITSPAGDDHILVSDRFTPGGTAYDGIIRGYDDGSLTPDSVINLADTISHYSSPDSGQTLTLDSVTVESVSSFTTRVRGKYMLVSNFELQFPIIEQQIYGLLFFDAGNSWLHREDIKPFKGLYKGVGIGFRIVVPGIGTIGFDFAKRLDDYRGGVKGDWKAHFQMGTIFR